jgi:ubiquinone/menaquinone biosynthesis C-methylase UbiE
MTKLDALYADLWTAHGDLFAALDHSLEPRSWTFLFDIAGQAGLGSETWVADVGCGRGNHCFELARRFGCRAVGIDMVLPPLQTAALSENRPGDVGFVQGGVEHLPIRTQ